EPAPGMTARARKTAAELGRAQIDIIEATAEDAPIDAASIDTAVISFVLCTIPDWRSALAQVRRFLKPDGKILFAEHGLAPDASVVKWQRRLEPFQKRLGGGCHLTRNPAQMLSDAGFSVRRCETMYLPKTPKTLGYQYWGEAVAA
ncbi:MAG: methyltransferase domain-containing protein, partial [Pseudomonadota bacterium]